MDAKGITILGLGPGDPALLTRQAWNWLHSVDEVYLRTDHHPTVAGLPVGLVVHSFDRFYDQGESFEAVYERIISEVLELGRRPQGVTYAVPGHPYVAEATCPEIVRRARQDGLPVTVIDGLSFLEPVYTALEIDPYPQLALVDALGISTVHHPQFTPHTPVLIAQIYSQLVAAEVKMTLLAVYPDEHPVKLIHAAGTPQQVVETLPLYEVDRSAHLGLLSSLYVPALPDSTAFEAFQEVVARLRAPDGCVWDRAQTHESLRKHLLEETYEALDALDRSDPRDLQEELGDLLLQIVLHAQIAYEAGEFKMTDVLSGVHNKIVRRHPHVFGDWQVDGVGTVLQNWEKLKEAEREANGVSQTKGLLDGLPGALPALTQAAEYQDRAARVGFDWSEVQAVMDKVCEEVESFRSAATPEGGANEVGDLIFAVVNLARWLRIDAESALRETNLRFRRRFAYIEKRVRELGKPLSSTTRAEMDGFWNEARQQGL
jgi:tetrapyrrole methylase family protein/MazG family protein